MELSTLHFAQPYWLLTLIALPLIWVLYFLFYQANHSIHHLEKFIDRHLLSHLLLNHTHGKSSPWKKVLGWSVAWTFLALALAGPRWNFREIETFSADQSLVLLLDLSESMNARDVKPSRLNRAKQKIEDLINLSQGVKIGLIGFAADPHMITPLTDDKETIRYLLHSLETDLAYIQGSRLSSALEMASHMLEVEPGNNKALLVISDGGFEDASAISIAKKLFEKGIVIHAMGVGTPEGAPVQDHQGNVKTKTGSSIISKLDKEMLNAISKVGNGHYLEAHYSDHAEATILKELKNKADAQINIGKKTRLWDEGFYFLILPALVFILGWFRRGYIFAILLFFSLHSFGLEASSTESFFKNSEELGKKAFDEGDYETAFNTFQDPYRKGVAGYLAGKFEDAEQMFRQSSRKDVACNALYNLGNALVQQQKLKEAISVYEDLLKSWPDHTKARENLELVKKMLEEQQSEKSSQSNNSHQQEDQSPTDAPKKENKQEDSKDKASSEKENKTEEQSSSGDSESEKENQTENQKTDSNNKNEQLQENESQKKLEEDLPHSLEEEKTGETNEQSPKEEKYAKTAKSQEDQDADHLLNRIDNDPKHFLKNKFYIESKRNGTKEGIDPW